MMLRERSSGKAVAASSFAVQRGAAASPFRAVRVAEQQDASWASEQPNGSLGIHPHGAASRC